MMKVAELSGALLDYWVAKAEGPPDDDDNMPKGMGYSPKIVKGRCFTHPTSIYGAFSPSENWRQGGPIIERELGDIGPVDMIGDGNKWHASMGAGHLRYRAFGPTPLIAAMRAYVASKYGDEVLDEE